MRKFLKKNDLVKIIFFLMLFTVALTWIIKGGSYQMNEYGVLNFVENEDHIRTGINEISISGVYAVNFFLQQMVFVILLGSFYGIISLTNGYRELVKKCAKFIKGKEIITVLVVSALIATYVSISSQVFVALTAIPFIITVLLNANLDKKTAFITTFGSIFIGILGATYGTDGLYYFKQYVEQYIYQFTGEQKLIDANISMKFAVLAFAYVVFNFFNVLNVKKVLKNKKVNDIKEDSFAVEEPTRKNTRIWPMIVLLLSTFTFAVLGYIRWETDFKIEKFNKFHEWLIGLKIGKNEIVSHILGNVSAFGKWELFSILGVFLVIAIISAIIYRLSFDDFIDGALEGASKMIKPVFVMTLAYSIFVLVYWSPIVPSIVNDIITTKFKVFPTAIAGLVSSFFVSDFGYTGYSLGQYFALTYASNVDKLTFILSSVHGLVQTIAPTSALLVFGLTYSKVSYKEWIAHIWKYLAIMVIALSIVFTTL